MFKDLDHKPTLVNIFLLPNQLLNVWKNYVILVGILSEEIEDYKVQIPFSLKFLREIGDLFYLDLETLEGETFTITAWSNGYYVNASKGQTEFNPAAR